MKLCLHCFLNLTPRTYVTSLLLVKSLRVLHCPTHTHARTRTHAQRLRVAPGAQAVGLSAAFLCNSAP